MNDKPHSHFRIALPLAMTTALGPLALDAYLPAFPVIARSLGVGVHDISLTIAIYVFVLALGQLVGGPLSDRFGRARIMLSGLAIFGIASFLIAQSTSLEQLLLYRALQAFGGGWATVCVPAVVRDKLSGQEAARFFSLIGLITVAAPAIAPSLGSLLLSGFGWTSIFLFLAGYGGLMMVLLKLLMFAQPQPLPAQHSHIPIWQRYKAVFAIRPALRFMLLQAMAFAVMLLFITHSSYIYQEHFGVGPSVFALLFGANIVMMLAVNLTNRKLLKTVPAVRILRWGLTMQATGVVLLLVVMLVMPKIWLFVPAMMITVGALGAIASNTQACFMEYFHQHGGTAAAVIGAATFALGGLISAGSSLLPESVTAIVFAQAACSAVCLWLIWTRKADQTHQY